MKQNYIIESGELYSTDYFTHYENRILTPASITNPHAHSRYDFKILGTLYNVYTKEMPDRTQKVTSIWNRTSDKEIEKLEVLVVVQQ